MGDFSIWYLIISLLILIPSAIFHEYVHGIVAESLGDHTAKYSGRLTLNPIAHFDLWGTLLLPLSLFFLSSGRMMFGYPKPVPINPYNLRDQKWGLVWVSLAGPASNLLLAFTFGIIYHLVDIAGVANLIEYIVWININLAIFNLLPIPPLDGSRLLFAILPEQAAVLGNFFERYGIILIILFSSVLIQIIDPIITGLFNLIIR